MGQSQRLEFFLEGYNVTNRVNFAGGGNGSIISPAFLIRSRTLYAYATASGQALWQFETAREFTTVNGVPARGGNISGAGPVVAGGLVFITSGYSDLGNGVRGNVLLAFGAR